MNFVQWLNSLDALLYELMGWLIFFPLTLWKIVRHPLDAMLAVWSRSMSFREGALNSRWYSRLHRDWLS